MLRQGILCCDIVGQSWKIFCRDRVILSCDRVCQSIEDFCYDRGFLGRFRVGHDKKLCFTRQSWVCEGLHARQCGVMLCRGGGGHVR